MRKRNWEKSEVRELLLKAGADAFLKHGFRKARLTDIVRAAGVTTGPLYWYFRNKEDLFGALVSDAYEGALALLDVELRRFQEYPDNSKTTDLSTHAHAFAAAFAKYVFSHRVAFRLLASGCAAGTPWDGLARRLAETEYAAFAGFIEEMERNAGKGDDTIRRDTLVELISGIYDALIRASLRSRNKADASAEACRIQHYHRAGFFALFDRDPLGRPAATPPSNG